MIIMMFLQCKSGDAVRVPVNKYGKLQFPGMVSITALSELIGVAFCFLFLILLLDYFKVPCTKWIYNNAFQTNAQKVKSAVSINDMAEQSVKVSSDFLETSPLEDIWKAFLQVVGKIMKDLFQI